MNLSTLRELSPSSPSIYQSSSSPSFPFLPLPHTLSFCSIKMRPNSGKLATIFGFICESILARAKCHNPFPPLPALAHCLPLATPPQIHVRLGIPYAPHLAAASNLCTRLGNLCWFACRIASRHDSTCSLPFSPPYLLRSPIFHSPFATRHLIASFKCDKRHLPFGAGP